MTTSVAASGRSALPEHLETLAARPELRRYRVRVLVLGDEAIENPAVEFEDRIALNGRSLREHTARGAQAVDQSWSHRSCR